jgi:hypothetical protein
MAFDIAGLGKMADMGQGRTLWAYFTTDAAIVVDSAAYFTGSAVDMLRIGDLILRVTAAAVPPAAVPTAVGWHVVASNDGTTVDVTDTTVLTLTDTD